jgi:hypothetical protein
MDFNTKLYLAIDDQDVDEIEELLKSKEYYVDLNYDLVKLNYALIKAVKLNSFDIVKIILTQGVEYTCIFYVLEYICKNDNLDILKFIFDHFEVPKNYHDNYKWQTDQ